MGHGSLDVTHFPALNNVPFLFQNVVERMNELTRECKELWKGNAFPGPLKTLQLTDDDWGLPPNPAIKNVCLQQEE